MPGSTRTPAFSQSEQIRRFVSVEVAQLLCDIGEASAQTSPVHLFRLCLDAQRLLANVNASGARAAKPEEAVLLALFRDMDGDGQERLIGFSKQLQQRFPRPLASLTLVRSSQSQTMGAV